MSICYLVCQYIPEFPALTFASFIYLIVLNTVNLAVYTGGGKAIQHKYSVMPSSN